MFFVSKVNPVGITFLSSRGGYKNKKTIYITDDFTNTLYFQP